MYFNKIVFFLFLIDLCFCQEPADKGANAKTKQILQYIAGLSKQSITISKLSDLHTFMNNVGKYLSGQFVGFGDQYFNLSQVEQIYNQTGEVPAILGCDYTDGFFTAIPPQKLINYSCNSILIDHWNRDGLISINTHFPNPVSANGGDVRTRSNLTFTDLFNFETVTGQRWRSYLDIVAEGFANLQRANVTVLYRPFHEMNGNWFWWGRQVS